MLTLLAIFLSLVSLFLILLVLVQRGRGGGLTGALGGMGGQSAFGTKAGDTFTRVTIVAAAVWIVFSIVALKAPGWLGLSGGLLGNPEQGSLAPAASEAMPSDMQGLQDLLPEGGAGGETPAGGAGALPEESPAGAASDTSTAAEAEPTPE